MKQETGHVDEAMRRYEAVELEPAAIGAQSLLATTLLQLRRLSDRCACAVSNTLVKARLRSCRKIGDGDRAY